MEKSIFIVKIFIFVIICFEIEGMDVCSRSSESNSHISHPVTINEQIKKRSTNLLGIIEKEQGDEEEYEKGKKKRSRKEMEDGGSEAAFDSTEEELDGKPSESPCSDGEKKVCSGEVFKVTFIYPNGDKYEGAVERGKRNGNGRYTFTDGTVHDGEWKDNWQKKLWMRIITKI